VLVDQECQPSLYLVVNPEYDMLSKINSLSEFLGSDLKIHHPIIKFVLKSIKQFPSFNVALR